jgi:hypothetical protein
MEGELLILDSPAARCRRCTQAIHAHGPIVLVDGDAITVARYAPGETMISQSDAVYHAGCFHSGGLELFRLALARAAERRRARSPEPLPRDAVRR